MPDDFIPTDREATEREDGYAGWDEHGPIFEAPEPEVFSRLLMATDGAPWWPRASKVQLAPIDGGSILDGYAPKGLWHTTETSSWPSYSTNYHPHMTVGLVDGRFQARQHIPLNRAARALRNESGGTQTNRSGVKQVEIITRADIVDVSGLPAVLEDGLADWAVWLKANWDVPMTCTVTFKPYPASYGKGNGVRLGAAAWEQYAGWCGHQHAPENDHGDPGALDWRRILQAQEADDMPYTEAQIRGMIQAELTEFAGRRFDDNGQTLTELLGKYRGDGKRFWQILDRLDERLATVEAIASRVAAIESDVDTLVERSGP